MFRGEYRPFGDLAEHQSLMQSWCMQQWESCMNGKMSASCQLEHDMRQWSVDDTRFSFEQNPFVQAPVLKRKWPVMTSQIGILDTHCFWIRNTVIKLISQSEGSAGPHYNRDPETKAGGAFPGTPSIRGYSAAQN